MFTYYNEPAGALAEFKDFSISDQFALEVLNAGSGLFEVNITNLNFVDSGVTLYYYLSDTPDDPESWEQASRTFQITGTL